MADAVTQQKLNVWIFVFFGAAALILAAVGVAGVVSFAVSSRTREIGVRVALGATRSQVMRLVVFDGLRLTVLGLGAGLTLALVFSRSLAGLLFETAATDPLTYVGVAAFLLAVALAAGDPPARAALRLDPIRSLRAE